MMTRATVLLVAVVVVVGWMGDVVEAASQTDLAGAQGNAWTACTHLRVYGLNFDQGLARFLAYSNPQVKSVLEFGCGLGLYLDYVCRRSNATKVIGIEPEAMTFENSVFSRVNDTSLCPAQAAVNVLHASEAELAALGLMSKFDLVYSIEVLEHIPREFHDKMADFLVSRVDKLLVFSAARPNQEGWGHIAERPTEEWIEEFTSRGLVYLWRVTELVRRVCDKRNVNHKRNILVFARPGTFFADDNSSVFSRQILLSNPDDQPAVMWPELQAMSTKVCGAPA
ncbi:hypothetical protein PTSG_12062 [Salpingoeca rosetta]|uniref:Methyltransferase domain-containing protein n=1 Tax=Salpingoeca rosetta (strain ATCC 50818 / BSB-021) TaxID=946362 RepID=F2U6C3_SALR5|nr:uncharacterized protein PTSG_12062 [Salpingoeca rosetta]EGD83064.1 hypothetical protein PTSG_12062 [Salpingoeca rosetta]|eukprot:XP_004995428.1 hypothetical protein PTSG_12062 [Salpingoeca rosetta]